MIFDWTKLWEKHNLFPMSQDMYALNDLFSKLSLSKQDEVFNSKKFNFFVKSQEVWHSLCIVFNLL